MAKKSRERELTREEAIDQARLQLAPLWIPNPPLLAGVRTPENVPQVFPIDDSFLARRWIILCLDPAAASFESQLKAWREIIRRYSPHELSFLLVLSSPFGFYRDGPGVEAISSHYKLGEILTVDPDGALIAGLSGLAAGAQPALPHAILMDKGQTVGVGAGPKWFEALEPKIHRFLRAEDPGLALFDFYARASVAADGEPWNFATLSKEAKRPYRWSVEPVLNGEKVIVENEKTTLSFSLPGDSLAIVAESLDLSKRAAEVVIELNGQMPKDILWDVDLARSEMGAACIKAVRPRLYLALKDLPPGAREITLRFPTSERVKVSLYGIRYAVTSE